MAVSVVAAGQSVPISGCCADGAEGVYAGAYLSFGASLFVMVAGGSVVAAQTLPGTLTAFPDAQADSPTLRYVLVAP